MKHLIWDVEIGDGLKQNFEIGRILHWKLEIEISNWTGTTSHQSNLRFPTSNLQCRIRPISKFCFSPSPISRPYHPIRFRNSVMWAVW
jgi:hypothetical protein